MTQDELTSWIKTTAVSHGFSRVGVTSATALPAAIAERFNHFLAEGLHADMAYMANHVELRNDPSKLVPGARSVICLAVAYAPRGEGVSPSCLAGVPPASGGGTDSPSSNDSSHGAHNAGETPASHGVIARYARGRDYHTALKRRAIALMDAIRERVPEFQGRAFVDSAPVAERSLAVLAGLGVIGRNGCLIVPGLGSYVLLAEIVCNLGLMADEPSRDAGVPPALCAPWVGTVGDGQPSGAVDGEGGTPSRHAGKMPASRYMGVSPMCDGCGRCVAACPTGALRSDGLVDARRCVSYNTIENRGELPPDVVAAMRNRVFGCDACQEACPHNQNVPAGDAEFAGPASMDLCDWLPWDEPQWNAATRGKAIRRATWRMWQRNVVAVLTNRETERK